MRDGPQSRLVVTNGDQQREMLFIAEPIGLQRADPERNRARILQNADIAVMMEIRKVTGIEAIARTIHGPLSGHATTVCCPVSVVLVRRAELWRDALNAVAVARCAQNDPG